MPFVCVTCFPFATLRVLGVTPPPAMKTAALLLLLLVLTACVGPDRTTRIAVDDYQTMGVAMGESLASSDAVTGRTADSEPWVISIDKVTNLTSDVMTRSEQWAIVEKVRSALPLQTLWGRHRIRLVLPPDRRQSVRETAELDNPRNVAAGVTHVMTATFLSTTRAVDDQRSELYLCKFELIDLRTGEPVWEDTFEYKRAAAGRILD